MIEARPPAHASKRKRASPPARGEADLSLRLAYSTTDPAHNSSPLRNVRLKFAFARWGDSIRGAFRPAMRKFKALEEECRGLAPSGGKFPSYPRRGSSDEGFSGRDYEALGAR